jgi:hypothetical protein
MNTVKRIYRDPYRETRTIVLQKLARALPMPASALIEDVQESGLRMSK